MAMKKLINDPRDLCREMFEGFVAAHGRRYNLRQLDGMTVVAKNDIPDGRVAVVTGGGSGHEPLFIKAVGSGMADAAICGDIFAAPSPDLIVAGVKAVDRGAGVFIIHGNYAGDNMNFDMAVEMLAEKGVKTHVLRVWDDVASAPLARQHERRGMTADILLVKLAGALAERGASLEEMLPIMERAREWCRTIGVALTSATVPTTGELTFDIGDDEMEIGIGMHGEPGVGRAKLAPADEVCREMIDRIVADLPFEQGDEVIMIMNSMGATTLMELYIMNRQAHKVLEEKGIRVYDTHVGPLFTCQEMAGCMITLMKLDDEIKRLYDAPADSPDYIFSP
jgi:dihydroxyacetone kinase-like protein